MSIDRWADKMWCIYPMEYNSAIKKNEMVPFACNMDATRDYHNKWSQSERDKYDINVWNLKYDTNDPICKMDCGT